MGKIKQTKQNKQTEPISTEAAGQAAGTTADGPPASIESRIEELQKFLERVERFNEEEKRSAHLSKDDLTLVWDVRLVRDDGTDFVAVDGRSTLPRALAYNMVVELPATIQHELMYKAIKPLTYRAIAKCQSNCTLGVVAAFGPPAEGDL